MAKKTTPTHSLTQIAKLIQEGQYKTTSVARIGAAALGLDIDGLLAIVIDLPQNGSFYKTMESKQDPGHWMDVYHTVTPAGDDVYLKLMIRDGALIESFKEL